MGVIEVDARGMDCPQPVIIARKALEGQPDGLIHVLVDDAVQAENVAAMARNQGWDARLAGREGGFQTLILEKQTGPAPAVDAGDDGPACGLPTRVVVQVTSDKCGSGADELGSILMRSFIKTLAEVVPQPVAMVFLNSGVKLSTQGSEVAEDLQKLGDSGIDIINCGTCLDYYDLKDKLMVGRVSNMYEIASLLVNADRVVRP